MRYLLTIILILTCFFSAVAQGGTYNRPVQVEDGRFISIFEDEDGDRIIYRDQFGIDKELTDGNRGLGFQSIPETLSMYMFDDDDGLEMLVNTGFRNAIGDESTLELLDDDQTRTVINFGSFHGIAQDDQGAIIVINQSPSGMVYYRPQGNTPAYTRQQNQASQADTVYINSTVTQIDTVYISETISRIDTVRELITERIFTSDTVYINETITLAGDVDTLVINRTVTTRDTVYNFTEHTEYITRVDSLYLLGGDYLADLNSVTSVENQLEVEKLGNPYPNPASTTVSIDYVTAVPTANMFLGVYDNQGRRVEQFPVKPSHTITFDVSDWAPGVYVYMIWSPVGVSSTKRLVVE